MQKNLFVSFKASRAIPVCKSLTRDFLIQSTLDPDVRHLEYRNTVIADDRVASAEAIIVERFDGRYVIDFVDARPASDPTGEALMHLAFARKCNGIIELGAADVRAEPRCTSSREVWSHRTLHLYGDDRTEILGALESEGPTEIERLEASVMTRGEVRPTVYAMACEGTIELDLRGGLGDDMIVRAGNLGYSAALRSYGT